MLIGLFMASAETVICKFSQFRHDGWLQIDKLNPNVSAGMPYFIDQLYLFDSAAWSAY
jgi:hypothetical protein